MFNLPSVVLQARFIATAVDGFIGTLHADYIALQDQCVYVPITNRYCSSSFLDNARIVYRFFQNELVSKVSYHGYQERLPWLPR